MEMATGVREAAQEFLHFGEMLFEYGPVAGVGDAVLRKEGSENRSNHFISLIFVITASRDNSFLHKS